MAIADSVVRAYSLDEMYGVFVIRMSRLFVVGDVVVRCAVKKLLFVSD